MRPEPIQIELRGKVHVGTYTVASDSTVTVSCAYGSKSAHNGSIGPQHYAKFCEHEKECQVLFSRPARRQKEDYADTIFALLWD
jgi:hypothetical protein